MSMMLSNRSRAALGLFSALTMISVGCADEATQEDELSAPAGDAVESSKESLIAEVAGDGFKVKYLEPEPGVLVEEEQGSIEASHLPEDNGLDLVLRYELLAGKKAPAALVEAAARAGQPTHENESLVLATDHTGEKANPTSTKEWFQAHYCTRTDRFWQGNFFGSSRWSDRVEYMNAAAWVDLGGVWYDVSYSGGGSGSYWLTRGEYNGRRATSSINRAASSEVRSSTQTDQVLHCVNYHF